MDLRKQLGQRVDAAHFAGEATVVERHGTPRAVLVSYEWWVQHGGEETEPTEPTEAG
ncbi:hypothetical protein GCM10010387_15740 [Streptomyces inusitatus]|uniref:Antitoxin n=2 Tax=Streptomyces inusitatus TaxID=68221 RepID=A0A918PUR2_9ACTN|nr:hypothetical protein GCM10010387_15740 [Streptomyces inusitatus]